MMRKTRRGRAMNKCWKQIQYKWICMFIKSTNYSNKLHTIRPWCLYSYTKLELCIILQQCTQNWHLFPSNIIKVSKSLKKKNL
jgi:hypothetical protein